MARSESDTPVAVGDVGLLIGTQAAKRIGEFGTQQDTGHRGYAVRPAMAT